MTFSYTLPTPLPLLSCMPPSLLTLELQYPSPLDPYYRCYTSLCLFEGFASSPLTGLSSFPTSPDTPN